MLVRVKRVQFASEHNIAAAFNKFIIAYIWSISRKQINDLQLLIIFSSQLTSVLREVKYLSMLKHQNIPKAALHLYSKRERLYVVGN